CSQSISVKQRQKTASQPPLHIHIPLTFFTKKHPFVDGGKAATKNVNMQNLAKAYRAPGDHTKKPLKLSCLMGQSKPI
ncbi:hypothetical protein, partial [Pedobacter africanus]|uniref:hypothetical protein n=1 Tax=Pedobacter africanus TaxID=151894 RepID=UPI001F2D7B55